MKTTFVLDENVFIQSHTCRDINSDGNNYSSLQLVISILDKCHNIGLSPALATLYWQKSKMLEETKKLNSICARIWKDFLFRNDKHCYCDNQLNDLPDNVLHDRHIIEPAVFLSGILVTTDDKLKEKMKPWLKNHSSFLILSPSDALDYLASL